MPKLSRLVMPKLSSDDSRWLRAQKIVPEDLPDVPRWKSPRYLISEAEYWRARFEDRDRAFVRLAWLSGIVISLLSWALVGRWVWRLVG